MITVMLHNTNNIDSDIFVRRWHHTNSIAIMSYISNTSSNSQSAHN